MLYVVTELLVSKPLLEVFLFILFVLTLFVTCAAFVVFTAFVIVVVFESGFTAVDTVISENNRINTHAKKINFLFNVKYTSP